MEYNYYYCEICNRNQVKNKKHIYSKKHRERLDFLLTRQNEKFKKLSIFLKNIKLISDNIEQPEIWCIFCKTTIKSSNSKIACKHIFLHLSYESHIDSIDEFWKEQRPDKKKWKKEQFYLDKEVVNNFLKMSDIELNKYEKKKEKQLLSSKRTINPIDNINNEITNNCKYNLNDNIYKSVNNKTINNVRNNNISKSFRTIKAFSQNLTCININPNQTAINNIYNDNSIPPWMLDNSDSESNSEDERLDKKLNINKKKNDNAVIGPSLDLYISHKEKERKSKLNPKRLGSTIDRDKIISKNWMPNFGGIWNAGPRSSTRKDFLNEIKNNIK